jgi:hypothetical protein
MFIFTRELSTARFKAVAGMPVPARYDNAHARKFLKDTYGDDIIMELDYRRPENFLALIAKDSDASVRDQYAKLKMLADGQGKRIQALERENEQLKKRVAKERGGASTNEN